MLNSFVRPDLMNVALLKNMDAWRFCNVSWAAKGSCPET